MELTAATAAPAWRYRSGRTSGLDGLAGEATRGASMAVA